MRRIVRNWKMVAFWFAGALCFLIASMIAGGLQKTLGVNDAGYFLALILSLVLFLFGGLLWISVAIASKRLSDFY